MKNRAKWIIVPALVLSLGACKQKEVTQVPEASATDSGVLKTPAAPAESVAPKVSALSADERAAALGFAKYLPKDTEALLTFHNGSRAATELKAMKLWKFVETEVNGEAADAADAATPADGAPKAVEVEEGFGPADLLGTEVTVALGKTTGEQTANLLHVSQRSNYFQFRALAKALAEAAKSGDPSSFEEKIGNSLSEGMVKELVQDPESGIGSYEKAAFPPIYVAFRVVEEQREVAQQQIAGGLGFLAMLGEAVAPLAVEKSGAKFNGYKISGAKVSEMLAQSRQSMEETLGKENVERLLAATAKKDIVAVSGLVGDYVVLFIGSSENDLTLAENAGQSLVSSDALSFVDGYVKKDLSVVGYGEKGALEAIVKESSGISSIAEGIHDGLKGTEGIGDLSQLETLLKLVVEREAALINLATTEAGGVVGYLEDGYKLQTYGGTDNGAVDWKIPNKLAHLGKSEDTVLFANMTVDAAYDEKATAYFEALFETTYALTQKLAQLPQTGELAQYKPMLEVFDQQFRPDFVNIWDALKNDLGQGLGKESAVVIDLKGSVPPIPGLPQVLVDQGKFPRLTLIHPVTDRSKVGTSWEKINASATGMLEKVGGMTGQKIPMQKPISSEKNGYTTWFFPLPFFTDDFLPSVTVGDKWFALSSSKNQALDLIDQANTGGETSQGLTFTVNFQALQSYSKETLKLVDENAVAIFGQDTDKLAEFQANKAKIAKGIEALDDFDSLSLHARRESGQLRSTLHFKTR
ncbi:MAG: hypothetical protein QM680_08495 [Luteolibacter sp.]